MGKGRQPSMWTTRQANKARSLSGKCTRGLKESVHWDLIPCSYPVLPSPRYLPRRSLVRQDKTGTDPETPHPLRMHFLSAVVTSWLVSGRETYWPWSKCQRKRGLYLLSPSLTHLQTISMLSGNNLLHYFTDNIFWQFSTSETGMYHKIKWHLMALVLPALNLLCKCLLLTATWSHCWCETTLNEILFLRFLHHAGGVNWDTLPVWVMAVVHNLRGDFPLLSPPSANIDKCK